MERGDLRCPPAQTRIVVKAGVLENGMKMTTKDLEANVSKGKLRHWFMNIFTFFFMYLGVCYAQFISVEYKVRIQYIGNIPTLLHKLYTHRVF